MKNRLKKYGTRTALLVIFVVLFVLLGVSCFALTQPRNRTLKSSILTDTILADVSGKNVKTFQDCKEAGGVINKNPNPDDCYFDGVKYYEVPRKGLEDLNPPENLRTYTDCVRAGNAIAVSPKELSCTSWNGQTYYYTGPPVKTYEDCERVMQIVLDSNPRQCSGPDGTHFTGQQE